MKYTKAGPFWLKLSADRTKWIILEKEAELMRKAFRWCAEGMGMSQISERFHKEYPKGRTGKGWQLNSIRKLLRSRQAIGEYVPHVREVSSKGGKVKSKRIAQGQPIAGYFPAIVTEAEFYKAQAALDGRKTSSGGRITGVPNLFNGLLFDAPSRSTMVMGGNKTGQILVPSAALRKVSGAQFRAVPYPMFERAVIGALSELKPADVMGKAGPDEDAVELWKGKLAAVNHNIAQTTAKAAAPKTRAFTSICSIPTASSARRSSPTSKRRRERRRAGRRATHWVNTLR